jgi:outer membrane protein
MKPFLIFFSALLLFSCTQPQSESQKADAADTTAVTSQESPLKVAFIYGDTINEKYQFLIDVEEELEKERKVIEERIRRKLQKAEQRAAELQRQAPTMTQMEVQEAQLELQNLDIEIQQFQEKLATDFRRREIELQEDYIGRIRTFLEDYNSNGKYDIILNFQPGGNLLWIKDKYDVTQEVLDSLNQQYARELATETEAK